MEVDLTKSELEFIMKHIEDTIISTLPHQLDWMSKSLGPLQSKIGWALNRINFGVD